MLSMCILKLDWYLKHGHFTNKLLNVKENEHTDL